MKDDAPLPETVPRKRRQIEMLLDRHIAIWLAGDDLTPSERRKLEEERQRRRQVTPGMPVGLVVGHEGVTPEQLEQLPSYLRGASKILHAGVASRVHTACRSLDVPVVVYRDDMKTVVKEADRVIACVPYAREITDTLVWQYVRYARHRSTPVIAVMPDGTEYQGDA